MTAHLASKFLGVLRDAVDKVKEQRGIFQWNCSAQRDTLFLQQLKGQLHLGRMSFMSRERVSFPEWYFYFLLVLKVQEFH